MSKQTHTELFFDSSSTNVHRRPSAFDFNRHFGYINHFDPDWFRHIGFKVPLEHLCNFFSPHSILNIKPVERYGRKSHESWLQLGNQISYSFSFNGLSTVNKILHRSKSYICVISSVRQIHRLHTESNNKICRVGVSHLSKIINWPVRHTLCEYVFHFCWKTCW